MKDARDRCYGAYSGSFIDLLRTFRKGLFGAVTLEWSSKG